MRWLPRFSFLSPRTVIIREITAWPRLPLCL